MTTPQPLSAAPTSLLGQIRLLATDIDGTMTAHGKLPASILDAFVRLAAVGIEVLPVSGRPSGEVLGLCRYLPTVQRAIAENGATLVIPDEEISFFSGPPAQERLRAAAHQISQRSGSLLRLAPDAFCRAFDLAFLRDDRDEPTLIALALIAQECSVFLTWSSVHIHLSPVPLDKGEAVLRLAAHAGCPPRAIATIGDARNDVGLWVAGRFGLSVGTAAVLPQLASLPHVPDFVVGEAAAGWLTLAEALIAARRAP